MRKASCAGALSEKPGWSGEKGPAARRCLKAAREAYARKGSAGPCPGHADENSSVRQSRALRGTAAAGPTSADGPFSSREVDDERGVVGGPLAAPGVGC